TARSGDGSTSSRTWRWIPRENTASRCDSWSGCSTRRRPRRPQRRSCSTRCRPRSWPWLGPRWTAGPTPPRRRCASRGGSPPTAPNEFVTGQWRYGGDAARAYLALARGDSGDAVRRFALLPDSLCPACFLMRLTRVQSLERLGRDRDAAVLLDQLPFAAFWSSP